MNRYVLGLPAIMALIGVVTAAEKADADLEKIQGVWNLTSVEIDGKTIPPPDGGGTFVFGKDKKLVMKEKGKADKEGTFTMDASKNPKELDMIAVIDKEKEVVPTIYQLDGDTLKLACAAVRKGKRPAAFDSKNANILTLKRQKP
jgi:uncharacterized protein (TIGR03067 family)